MSRLRYWLCICLMCSTVATSSGCVTMRTINPPVTPTSPFGDLKPGDELALTLNDGRRVRIEVDRIDADTIVSREGVRYARADIARLQVRRISAARTSLLVVGIVVGVVFVAGWAVASALDSLWGP